MTHLAFNTAQFFLTIGQSSHQTIYLKSFSCDNDAISEDYCFQIDITTQIFYMPEQWLNQQGALYWYDDNGEKNYRHGVITEVILMGKYYDGFYYQLKLNSIFFKLKQYYHQTIFLDKTLTDIINLILEKTGFISSQWRCQIKNNPVIPYLVQYHESNFDFLQDFLMKHSISFIWQQTEFYPIAIFTDQLSSLQTKLFSLNSAQIIHQYSTMTLDQTASFITTNQREYSAGQLIKNNRIIFRIANIKHQVQQNLTNHSDIKQPRYHAELQLISSITETYRDSTNKLSGSIAPLLTCKTETAGENYPYLNINGGYYTRLPFDNSHSLPTQASQPQYLLQPHSNMHFANPPDSTMAVSFLEGDFTKPVLLGFLPTKATTISPVTATNHTQSIFHSLNHNQLLIDDNPGQEKIELSQFQQQNSVLLDASENNPKIQLKSLSGQINSYAAKSIHFIAQHSHIQNIQQNYQTIIQNQQQITTQQQGITFSSGQAISFSAKRDILFNTINQSIMLTTPQQSMLQAKQLFVQSQTGSINLEANNHLTLYAKQQIAFQANNTIILQASTSQIIFSETTLQFNTPVLSVNAEIICCPKPC